MGAQDYFYLAQSIYTYITRRVPSKQLHTNNN